MIRAPPTPTRTYPLFPYTTLFLSEMVYIGFGTKGLDELGFVPSDGGCAAVLAGDGERPHLGGEPGAGPERGESGPAGGGSRSEEHTSELQSIMRIAYAVFCLKKKKQTRRSRNLIRHHSITAR